MRELVFSLEYEPGCNAVADTLVEHPDTHIRSLSLHATAESLWRVDHATGPEDALADVEDAFLTADYYADCLASDHCGADKNTQVLESTDDTLVLYTYWERTDTCSSVPHMALDHLGEGVLFETRHEGRRYTWRIIHSGEGDVRTFFDDVEDSVGDCAGMDVERLTEASSAPTEHEEEEVDLPREQAEALRAAVDHGYYETPREITVEELAEELDVPRSTLTYRLRRAEAHMANDWADRLPAREEPSTRL